MAEIVPVVNCRDEEEVKARLAAIRALAPAGTLVHVDVADGRFTFHKTWNDPARWPALAPEFPAEVHLMTEEPERHAEAWLQAGAHRVIAHYEAVFEPGSREDGRTGAEVFALLRGKCTLRGAELMLSLNPETPVEAVRPFLPKLDGVQILAVHPGLAGQKFLPLVLEKVKFLRAHAPGVTIEMDGGMNPDTIAQAKAAGASVFASDSFVFRSADPKAAFQKLQRL